MYHAMMHRVDVLEAFVDDFPKEINFTVEGETIYAKCNEFVTEDCETEFDDFLPCKKYSCKFERYVFANLILGKPRSCRKATPMAEMDLNDAHTLVLNGEEQKDVDVLGLVEEAKGVFAMNIRLPQARFVCTCISCACSAPLRCDCPAEVPKADDDED